MTFLGRSRSGETIFVAFAFDIGRTVAQALLVIRGDNPSRETATCFFRDQHDGDFWATCARGGGGALQGAAGILRAFVRGGSRIQWAEA